ncbi:MAG: tagaturonate reductase [Clostridia bacterium]|nr:tagaturonate reductase [Clostridia bacterium]
MKYSIRQIRRDDDAAIEALIRNCLIEFGANHEGTAWTDPDLGRFSYLYNQPGRRYWIAEDENAALLGGVGIAELTGVDGVCELQKMYCTPQARGEGVAQTLLDTALQFAKTRYSGCYLETLENMKAARRFYEKNGFDRLEHPLGNTAHTACDVRYFKIFSKEETSVERILQFGTGNFLRAFACDFIDSLNHKGLYDGKIVIVSPTDSARVDAINSQNGEYHLLLRGVSGGKTVNDTRLIRSVSRAVNPYRDFDAFLEIAQNPELRFVISNTTEAGISFDGACRLSDKPCASFPGKVAQMLYHRYRKGLPGLVFFACELIDKNAHLLKKYVLDYCRLWGLPEEFASWVEKENIFCDTLVDRIVTGYPEDASELNKLYRTPDRLIDAAEPYHFWAIEGNYENELPFARAGQNVIWTDNISFYKKRKVRVLNGAHTTMVFPALLAGIETVGDCLKDEQLNAFLHRSLEGYILPVLGDNEENRAFAAAVLERFANPFIHHRLRSIALNSVSKYTARVLPTALDYYEKFGKAPRPMILSLCALLRFYRCDEPQDKAEHIDYIRNNHLGPILSNRALWGTDLSVFLPETEACFEIEDIREAIEWSM